MNSLKRPTAFTSLDGMDDDNNSWNTNVVTPLSQKNIYRYPNGDYYEGAWKNDSRDDSFIIREGYGILTTPSHIYSGFWKNDFPEGQGTLIIINSEGNKQFDGYFYEDGRRSGGLQLPNGCCFYGDFFNDFDERTGILTITDEVKELTGIDTMVGAFHHSSLGLDVSVSYTDGSKYDGQTKGYQMHGKGRYVDIHGNTYTGFFDNDVLYYGIYQDCYENIYEGYFSKSKSRTREYSYNGYGILYSKNGIEYRGKWNHGKKHGEGLLITSKKHAFHCQYVQGKRYSSTYIESADEY